MSSQQMREQDIADLEAKIRRRHAESNGHAPTNGRGRDTRAQQEQPQGDGSPSVGCRVEEEPQQPFAPFPLGALTQVVEDFCKEAGKSIGCDPALVVLPAISALSAVIGNAFVLLIKRKWVEPSLLWTAVVADSGTMKSPAMRLATSPIRTIQREQFEGYERAMQGYEIDLANHKQAVRDKTVTAAEQPIEPTCNRLSVNDVTIEKMADLLHENPKGVLLVRDELAGWFESFTKYKGKGGGSDVSSWLSLYNCDPITVDRKGRGTTHIERPFVSVTGSIQPGILRRHLTQEHLDAGLGARLLLAMPPKIAKRWSEAEVSEPVEGAYESLFRKLNVLTYRSEEGPIALGLSQEAKRRWVRFYNEWADLQADAIGAEAASLAKLEAVAPRLALLHHICTLAAQDKQIPGSSVSQKSMDAGIEMTRWFRAEQERVYATLGQSDQDADVIQLMGLLRRKGRLSPRDLQRSLKEKYSTASKAEDALNGLVRSGLAKWTELAPDGGGHKVRCVVPAT